MEDKPTILVVDGEPEVRNLLETVLRREGFSVLKARSGSEALSIARSRGGSVDILLSDVVMDDMDGPTLAKQLRRGASNLAVILMSGGCDPELLRTSRRMRFLAKPFGIAELLRALGEYCHRVKYATN